VRQREVLSLEQAVHKLTAVPAALFGIPDRGRLAEGYVADLDQTRENETYGGWTPDGTPGSVLSWESGI
jgi:N-acyl-D-amino-acid deacylase